MPTLAYAPESPTARTRSAVSRPSASHPAVYTMRIGCRLACIRRLSSREMVIFTGRCNNHAASAACPCVTMSSLPPKAPPLETSSTVTRSRGRPSRSAMSLRSSHTPWPPDHTCSVPASTSGRASVDSGSRNACSMRCDWNSSCTTWALAASAASTSPRWYTERDSTLSSVPHTATGASGSMAATGSVTTGSGA